MNDFAARLETDEELRSRTMRLMPVDVNLLLSLSDLKLDQFVEGFGIQRVVPVKVDRKLDADEVASLGGVPGVQMTVVEAPRQRKYLPTFADLIDRMTIVLQKEIFISERRAEYRAEMALIMQDIDLILEASGRRIGAKEIHAIVVIQLANAFIWANETKVRNGSSTEPDAVVLRLLRATHAVNGVRANGKNMLSEFDGGRQDYKIDCFAAELIKEFGNWNIFDLGEAAGR